ncbi:MAG: hypothetical protein ACI4EX_05770 [Lachnospiraceae bacterium]
MTKESLIYEIGKKRHSLEFELKSCEFHRVAIEKRIKEVQIGIFYYAGILIGVPALISLVDFLLSTIPVLSNLRSLCGLAQILFAFTIPVWVFQIFKCLLLQMQNRENVDVLITPPPVRHPVYQRKRPPEPSMRSEYERVCFECQRYLYFLDQIEIVSSRAELACTEEEYDELFRKLDDFPLYEEITPAPSFPKNRTGGIIIFVAVFISIIFVLTLLVVLDPFGTMR